MITRSAQRKDSRIIDDYVERSESSSLYHYYVWRDVIEKSFGHDCYYLVCENERGVVGGILPLVHMKSALFGNQLVSMPFFNYGGVCADDEKCRDLLLEESIRKAKDLGAGNIEFRQVAPLNNGFPVKTAKVSMRLRLPDSAEELWRSFPSKLRSQIRRTEKEGMEIRVGRFEELDSFYSVFSINMRDLGTPVYPKYFFWNILNYFPRNTWICSIYMGKTAVASGFLAGAKGMLEIPWASSIRRYNKYSPNMLLYWTSLSFACRQGYSVFDFGRSTAGESTYKFKEQWGAAPVQLHWHYWLRQEGEMPEINPRNPKYRWAIEIWKKLPVPLTTILGPPIVKNIP